MQWTKQRIALCSILGLGACALVADRMFFAPAVGPKSLLVAKSKGAPATPNASTAPDGSARGAVNDETDTADLATKPPESAAAISRIADRLDELPTGWLGPMHPAMLDGFHPPLAWLPQIVGNAKAPEPAATSTVIDLQPTLPSFVLTMVGRRAGVPVAAVINGRAIPLGSEVEGYRLVALSASEGRAGGQQARAVLEGPAGRVEVELASPTQGERPHAG